MERQLAFGSVINLRGLVSRTNGEGAEVQCACVCFHVYACHCEVAPVCAVIAADRGREAANFSSGERQEGAGGGEVFDEQDRCRKAEIPRPKKKTTGTKRGRMTD